MAAMMSRAPTYDLVHSNNGRSRQQRRAPQAQHMTAIGFHVLEYVPAACFAVDLGAIHAAPQARRILALIAYVRGYLAQAGERVHIAEVWAVPLMRSPGQADPSRCESAPRHHSPALVTPELQVGPSTTATMQPQQPTPVTVPVWPVRQGAIEVIDEMVVNAYRIRCTASCPSLPTPLIAACARPHER
jgi:hypothetical protein